MSLLLRTLKLTSTSANSTVENSADRVDQAQLAAIPRNENLPPAPIDGSIDKWFFISGAAV
jgi:inorganic pyrophosphatase